VESTRDQILRQIRGHREMTVAQLAEGLKLSPQAVRRHLDGLRADALIDVRQERHGVGRPSLVFFVTDRGEEMGGRTYVQLLSRMFRHLEKLDASHVSGATGRQVVDQVFSGIAEEVAADHRAEVRGETLGQRIEEASRALNQEGIVDGWEKEGDAFHLVNGDCPYLKLAEMSDAACSADRHSIELLVGAHVEQTRRIVDGAPCCEYIVRPQPVTLLEDEVKEQG
jgi:DeoR family transcriptional regulator, suf operon transcriptional repressor